MLKLPTYTIRAVGIVSIILACLGLWYNLSGFSSILNSEQDPQTPYFQPAFLVMTAICSVCYVSLIILGLLFLRLKTQYRQFLLGLMIFELIYFFFLALSWAIPNRSIALSIAAATGVANGGLMFQFILLFPIWAPIAVYWAHRKLRIQGGI